MLRVALSNWLDAPPAGPKEKNESQPSAVQARNHLGIMAPEQTETESVADAAVGALYGETDLALFDDHARLPIKPSGSAMSCVRV